MSVVPLCTHSPFHYLMKVTRPLTDLLQEGFHSVESRSRLKPLNLSFFYKIMKTPLRTYHHKGGGRGFGKLRGKGKKRETPTTPRPTWKGWENESEAVGTQAKLSALPQDWGADVSKVLRGRQNLRPQGFQLPFPHCWYGKWGFQWWLE